MAIPDFQTLMLPFLETLSDGKERRVKEMVALLAGKFHVSEEELLERLPSGVAPVFYNRVAWTKTHLKNAGLIENHLPYLRLGIHRGSNKWPGSSTRGC